MKFSSTRARLLSMGGLVIVISAGDRQIVGLKDDGTVLYSCINDLNAQIGDVLKWTYIVAVSSGLGEVMALRADGKLLVEGIRGFDEF